MPAPRLAQRLAATAEPNQMSEIRAAWHAFCSVVVLRRPARVNHGGTMSLMDVLQQYVNPASVPPADAESHFQEVARSAPPELVGQGIAGALRSDQTPPFNEMVAQLFGNSNPQQRAGLLNELLRSVGPGLLSGMAGGALGRVLQNTQVSPGASVPTVTPAQASQITPQEVSEVAAHAETKDPTIIDRVGGFYAEHPQVVKALGGIALAIALGRMANTRR